MRPRSAVAAAACVLAGASACAGIAVARPQAPERLPLKTLTTSNSQLGKVASIRSGLQKVTPCDGAEQALRPTWRAAAETFGLRWQVLAGITKIESSFGCNMGPSSAGAVGWTQFMPSTWADWGMDADGDGVADPHNSVDAVFSTARYLRVSGAPQSYHKAIFAYNHADWYVRQVLDAAREVASFNDADLDQLGRLTRRGVRLRARLTETRHDLTTSRIRLRELRGELKDARARVARTRPLLHAAEVADARARRDLTNMTTRYIDMTQGLSSPDGTPMNDEQLLSYLADVDPQDAVLVYQQGGALMGRQATALRALREIAGDAQQSHSQLDQMLADYQQAAEAVRADVLEAADRRRQAQAAADEAQQALLSLKRTERRYTRMYLTNGSGAGSLLDSPFASLLEGMDVGARMVLIARAELERGVREIPDGSNDAPDIAKYRSATAGNPGVGPWCAYFVSWVARQAGVPLGDHGQGFAAVDAVSAWAASDHRFIPVSSKRKPHPGDLVIFNEHIGIVESIDEHGGVTTIEGNTSNRVGRRHNRERAAVGWVRLG